MFFAKNKIQQYIISIVSGLVIGFFSGLIGVGGGEFRLPILLAVLKLPILFATATNLIIGLLVSGTTVALRFPLLTHEAWLIVFAMSVFSIVGGYFGSYLTGKIKVRVLTYCLCVFLALVGLKMLLTPFLPLKLVFGSGFSLPLNLILLSLAGFFIGIISGLFGVAGGEFRIPILMFLFALPIKLSGTISSAVAVATQIGSLSKRIQLRHVNKNSWKIALSMGITSILGSALGAKLMFFCNEKLLETILGLVLLGAALVLLRHSRN